MKSVDSSHLSFLSSKWTQTHSYAEKFLFLVQHTFSYWNNIYTEALRLSHILFRIINEMWQLSLLHTLRNKVTSMLRSPEGETQNSCPLLVFHYSIGNTMLWIAKVLCKGMSLHCAFTPENLGYWAAWNFNPKKFINLCHVADIECHGRKIPWINLIYVA